MRPKNGPSGEREAIYKIVKEIGDMKIVPPGYTGPTYHPDDREGPYHVTSKEDGRGVGRWTPDDAVDAAWHHYRRKMRRDGLNALIQLARYIADLDDGGCPAAVVETAKNGLVMLEMGDELQGTKLPGLSSKGGSQFANGFSDEVSRKIADWLNDSSGDFRSDDFNELLRNRSLDEDDGKCLHDEIICEIRRRMNMGEWKNRDEGGG